MNMTDTIRYIGVNDADLDLFENQYPVPNGITYNSYFVLDEKIAIIDTVDRRKSVEWWERVESALDERTPDYLVVQHMEPDHTGNIAKAMQRYPKMQVVASVKAVQMLPQFFGDTDFSQRTIAVKEGDTLSLGVHTLQFIMAPMVHWPEVMVTYEQVSKVLFSADAFGTFGVLHDAITVGEHTHTAWPDEARRYYYNICGKYGSPVQTLLKKLAVLDIGTICPLHGPVLNTDLDRYIGLYDKWSRYEAESEGVLIAYASIHGGTAEAARCMAALLESKGASEVVAMDLCRCDMSAALAEAFRLKKMVLAAASYDASVFPPMYDFLHHLKMKGYQNRRVGIIENGSWAPTAGRVMNEFLAAMKDIEKATPMVTIRSTMKQADMPAFEELATAMLA